MERMEKTTSRYARPGGAAEYEISRLIHLAFRPAHRADEVAAVDGKRSESTRRNSPDCMAPGCLAIRSTPRRGRCQTAIQSVEWPSSLPIRRLAVTWLHVINEEPRRCSESQRPRGNLPRTSVPASGTAVLPMGVVEGRTFLRSQSGQLSGPPGGFFGERVSQLSGATFTPNPPLARLVVTFFPGPTAVLPSICRNFLSKLQTSPPPA
jgi:hypothetical protein